MSKELLELIKPIIDEVLAVRADEIQTNKKVHDEIYTKLVEVLTKEDINKLLEYKFEIEKIT